MVDVIVCGVSSKDRYKTCRVMRVIENFEFLR